MKVSILFEGELLHKKIEHWQKDAKEQFDPADVIEVLEELRNIESFIETSKILPSTGDYINIDPHWGDWRVSSKAFCPDQVVYIFVVTESDYDK